jgi:hypothetical protein
VLGDSAYGDGFAFRARLRELKMEFFLSTSLQSLHGAVPGNPPSLTIGSDGWQLNSIALRNSFLVGPFTGRGQVEALRPQMNFLMRLSLGLEIQNRGSARIGRRAKDWRSSSHIAEPYWFWTAWSRSRIRPVRKKDAYVNLPSRHFCANLPPSMRGYA